MGWTDEATYMKSGGTDNLWAKESLKTYGCSQSINPFSLRDQHPLVILRYSLVAFRSWIKDEEDENMRGPYRRQLWKKLMIRRTFESPVPGKIGELISKGLPAVMRCTIYLEHSGEMETELCEKTILIVKKLYGRKANGRPGASINFGVQ